jgi:hypothetical protein
MVSSTSELMTVAAAVSDADGRIDNPDAYAEGWPAEVSTRPLRLHTPQVEQGGPRGGLGGHCFSADFARYLARVQPRECEQAYQARRHWWASDYGRARVQRRFQQRYGAAHGQQRYLIAFFAAVGYRGAEALAAEAGKSSYWCSQQRWIAERFAREPAGCDARRV